MARIPGTRYSDAFMAVITTQVRRSKAGLRKKHDKDEIQVITLLLGGET